MPSQDKFPPLPLPDLFFEPAGKLPDRKSSSKKTFPFLVIAFILALIFFTPLNFSVNGVARIGPKHDVVVEALTDGELVELYVREGDQVKAGEKIALVYDRTNELELGKAKDDLIVTLQELALARDRTEFLKRKVGRNQELFERDAITASEKEALEFEYHETLQKANIMETKAASLNLKIVFFEKMRQIGTVRSPIDGVILTKISDQLSTYFKKGDELCRVANMSQVVLEMPVYENQLRRIRVGQGVQIKFYAYPDRVFKGVVTGIQPSAYEKTEKVWVKENVVNVLIKVEEELPFVVRSGTTSKVSIRTGGESLFTQLRGAFLF